MGDYRSLCQMLDNLLVILVLMIGHRKDVCRADGQDRPSVQVFQHLSVGGITR